MKFAEFVNGPEKQKNSEASDKLTVDQWISELTDGKGLDVEKVYIIVGSFINKLKK
jgi:hypothetical protein